MKRMPKSAIEEMHENVDQLKKTSDITDEANLEVDEDLSKEEEEEEKDEYTALEVEAMKKGWSPDKDEMPEGKEWIDAGEFLRNEKFFSEIRKLKRENTMTKKTVDALKEHHKKILEAERKKLTAQLKRQKVEALEEGNHAAVVEIDEQLDDVKEQGKAADKEVDEATATTQTDADFDAYFQTWVVDNQWYKSNAEMREIADSLGRNYFSEGGGSATPEELFAHVTRRVKELYPTETGGKPKRRVQAVEAASAGSHNRGGKQKFTEKDLNAEQRQVMNRFVKLGAVTKEQYIQELVDIGELV